VVLRRRPVLEALESVLDPPEFTTTYRLHLYQYRCIVSS
jgi:hypothetical protein